MSSFISSIQTKLKQAGFYNGAIDCIAGPQTVKAVEASIADKNICTPDELAAIKEQNVSHPTLVETQTLDPVKNNTKPSGFKFSATSQQRLGTVKTKLQLVVQRALEISTQDFTVLEGRRTVERQRQLLAKGATQTMKSNHITGDAVDLAPIVNGQVSWDWKYYYPIAQAMKQAAQELNVVIRWGGAWEVLNGNKLTPEQMVQQYTQRKKALGQKAFTDGPHYELYPVV